MAEAGSRWHHVALNVYHRRIPANQFNALVAWEDVMSRIIVILMTLLISLPCVAEERDKCLYGPYDDDLSALKAKHPGSRYTKNHKGVIVPVADGEVTVSYTGCTHYGMEISLAATRKEPFTREEAFARAVELVREFTGKNINPDKLKNLLAQGKYEKASESSVIVPYPYLDELAIEFFMGREHPMVIVSYYCC